MSTNCCFCGEELWGDEGLYGTCGPCRALEEQMRDPEPAVLDDEDTQRQGADSRNK